MKPQSEKDVKNSKEARQIAKELADLVEVEIGKMESINPKMQGMIYQLLASWFLGASQMLAKVIGLPDDIRDKLFNMIIQDSLEITEKLLSDHDSNK